MTDQFFEQPILNSPYEYPARHWELDASGQPTSNIIDKRRPSAAHLIPVLRVVGEQQTRSTMWN